MKIDIDEKLQELTFLVEEFKEKAGINKATRKFYVLLPRLIKAMKIWQKKQRRVK